MNKTRKVFLAVMACVVMLFATACGELAFKHGSWSGQTYSSEFFGFSVKGESGWNATTDEGIAKFHDISDLSSGNIKSVLNKGAFVEMMLSKPGGTSINIYVYDNEKFPQYREYQYVDARIKSIEDEFGAFSTISYNAKQSTVDFLGKLTVCVETDMTLSGLSTTYGYEIPVVKDNFTASIVLSAPSKEELNSAIKRFSAI